MKKTLRMKIMLLLFALVVGISNVWATDYSYNFSSGGTHNSSASPKTNTWTTDYFTLFQQRGSNTATEPANQLTAPRWYQNNTITVTPAANVTITQIVITYTGSYTGGTISYPTSQSLTHDSNKKTQTWSGSITSSTPLVLTMGAQCRPTTFAIVYSTSGGNTPTITVTGTLKDFAFATNDGPSMPQTISVSGSNLTNNISLSVGNESPFEISTSSNSGWTNTLSLTQSNGTVSATNIYIRMKNFDTNGNKNGTLNLQSSPATAVNVTLNGSIVTPLTVAEARAAIDDANRDNVENAYVKGIVSEIVTAYNSTYGNISYNISSDGLTTSDQLQAFRGKNFYGEKFTSADDIQVGDVVLIFGNMTLYQSTTYEFTEGNYLLTHKTIRASETELENFTYIAGHGPSDAQSFTIDGANLTADLTLSLDENSAFEISESENAGYTDEITLTPSNGAISNKTIYASLKEGKSVGDYEGTITITSTGANSPQIALSGSVTAQTYTIEQKTAPATAHGTINFSYEGALTEGKSVTLSTVPADGYEFTANSWKFYNKGTGSEVTLSVNNNAILMPAYNLQVDATFAEKTKYDITSSVTPANSGTIATDSEAWEGKEVMVLVEAEDGYAFSSLSVTKTGDAGTTVEYSGNASDGFTFTMPAYAVTVTATFVPVYHVYYNANIVEATGSTTDSNDYEEDDEATVLVCGFTKTGYAFSHWNTEDDDSGESYDPNNVITIGTADVTLYAQWVEVSSVTYTIASTSSVNTTGTAPLGSIASFSTTYSDKNQLTNGNSMTLTVKGCQGRTVKSIVLSMKSNASSGSGNMTAKAGNTIIASIATGTFASSQWHGSYSSSYVNITPAMSNANYELKSNEDIVITIAATANSLFCESFTINYATTTKDPMVFTLPSAQVVTNAEQEISTSDDEAFSIASLNIATPSYSIAYCDKDGNVLGSNPYSWFTPSINSNKVEYSVTANTADVDRKAYFKVYATVSATNYYSALCSVTQKHQPFTYTLVDGTDVKLEAGKRYIIASGGSGTVKVMGAQSGGFRTYVDNVSVSSSQITEADGMYEVVFSGDNTNYWTMYDVNYDSFICSTNSGGSITTSSTISNNTKWSVSISSGAATINAQAGDAYKFRYNSGSPRFAGYVQSSGIDGKVYLFKRDNDKDLEFYSNTSLANQTLSSSNTMTVESGATLTLTGTVSCLDASWLVVKEGGQLIVPAAKTGVQATFQREITGFTSTKDGYLLLANPTTDDGGINPTSVTGMLADVYDLYYFDESKNGVEWRNYRKETFNLVKGTGYLYANSVTKTLEFAGTAPTATSVSDIPLSFTAGNNFKGFNLMGNPMAVNITGMKINSTTCSYYKLKSDGTFESATASSSTPVIVGQAFVVEAASKDDVLHLNPASKDANEYNDEVIRLEVSNNKYTDVAYICFGNSLPLTKINHLNDEAPMLYVHCESADRAVAVMNERSEVKSVNINFEAKTMGTYTISGKAEKGNFSYMHLYDRLTGVDTDLLENDYTFIGSTNDAAGRFILRFEAIDNNAENESFAYQNGSDIIVNGEGELQIFDVMGRMVSTQQINGVERVNVKSQGVYIFRLNEKTQKIVVR